MKPVTETPTERSHYALISVAYASLLGASAAAARERPLLQSSELVPLSAATFALAKLLVHEKVETWVRAPFVEESEDGKKPKGRGLRFAVGELLTCTRCSGAWSALALVSLRSHSPDLAKTITTVLSVSAGNDFLHSSFTWLASRTNIETARADAVQTA